MNRKATAMAMVALLALSSGCGRGSTSPDDQPPTSQPAAPSSTAPSTADSRKGITITTDSSEFGTMLFGPNRQAIYIWERESSPKPKCYGDCAEAWPPVLSDGEPKAAGTVEADLLGTTKRKDGSTQVTYAGHPLYYYDHEGPGEVKCHNVATHGGLWWVVQPDGKRAP